MLTLVRRVGLYAAYPLSGISSPDMDNATVESFGTLLFEKKRAARPATRSSMRSNIHYAEHVPLSLDHANNCGNLVALPLM